MHQSLPNQIATEAQSLMQSQLQIWATLNNNAIESATRLVDLNMKVAKQSLANSSAAMQKLQPFENASATSWVDSSRMQTEIGNVLSYGRQVADIALGMQAEVAKLTQEQVDETNRKMMVVLDDMAKNAPEGACGTIDLMRSTINHISQGCAQWANNAIHATDLVDSPVSTSDTVPSPAKKSSRGKK